MSLYKVIDDHPFKRRREVHMVSAHRFDAFQCSVCLSNNRPSRNHLRFLKQLPCGHAFHPYCINRWLNTRITCPLCRVQCYDMVRMLPLRRTFLFTAENHSMYNLDTLD